MLPEQPGWCGTSSPRGCRSLTAVAKNPPAMLPAAPATCHMACLGTRTSIAPPCTACEARLHLYALKSPAQHGTSDSCSGPCAAAG